MPRTAPALFRKANRYSPNVATLLLACRDIGSALNEYRWIKEHVANTTPATQQFWRTTQLCRKRGNGVPLQYILGSQPFGQLDIRCKPGVLIPRPETEAYTYNVANLVKSKGIFRQDATRISNSLKVLDLCTGAGCIPLLLFSLLQKSFPALQVHGVDVSSTAIALAELNKERNIESGNMAQASATQSLTFTLQNILDEEGMEPFTTQPWDIVVSNPPYISHQVWNNGSGQLGHSVRKYEPQLALVPSADVAVPADWSHQDAFYARLLHLTTIIQPKLLVTELGDKDQAIRVLERFVQLPIANQFDVEVWRDWPDLYPEDTDDQSLLVAGADDSHITVQVKGVGEIRSLVFTKK